MISQDDINIIKELSGKYAVGKIILFGSSLDPKRESNDIDIAIEGVAPKDYYQYCSDLTMSLSKPVDIVDLSVPCKFVDLIIEEGVVLYG